MTKDAAQRSIRPFYDAVKISNWLVRRKEVVPEFFIKAGQREREVFGGMMGMYRR